MINSLRAEASEKDTIDGTVVAILLIPSFEDVAKPARDSSRYQMRLKNYISYVVQEETVSLPYAMQHPPQTGQIVQQKMLYIEKSKPYPRSASNPVAV